MSYQDLLNKVDPRRKDTLLEAAQPLMIAGIPVMATNAGSIDPVDGKPITDMATFYAVLANNPAVNVAAVIDQSNNLIAIKLERENNYCQDPKESLQWYEDRLGELPATMTLKYSDSLEYWDSQLE